MSVPEETLSEELYLGDESSLFFQILNGVAPIIYTFGLVSTENSTESEISSEIGVDLHRGNYNYSHIKKVSGNLVKTFIIFNIKEQQLKAMADKYNIKDYLFVQRENGVFTLSQDILSQFALNTAKYGGERFTLTKDELSNLSEKERHKVGVLNKQTYESLADNNLTESSGWHTRGQVRLFYDRLFKDMQ